MNHPKPSSPITGPAPNAPTPEQISELAHTLWLEEGKPAGRELQHWLEAERQLRAAGGTRPRRETTSSAGGLSAGAKADAQKTRDIESDKRVDGLGPPNRDPRTPKGERL